MGDEAHKPTFDERLLDVHRELSLVPDREERRKILRENVWAPFEMGALVFAWVAFDVAVARPGRRLVAAVLVGPPWLTKGLWIVVFAAARLGLVLVLLWILRRRVQKRVRKALQNRGYAVCIDCGYDLRATTEPRCPECGAAFAVSEVRRTNARDQVV